MSDAYECDGVCGDLYRGSPAAVVVLPEPVSFGPDNEETLSEAELCPACLQKGFADLFREMPDAEGTDYEQEDSNSDREWKVDSVKCGNCGERYPKSYTRCQNCGHPNQQQ